MLRATRRGRKAALREWSPVAGRPGVRP